MHCLLHPPHKTAECWLRSSNHTRRHIGQWAFCFAPWCLFRLAWCTTPQSVRWARFSAHPTPHTKKKDIQETVPTTSVTPSAWARRQIKIRQTPLYAKSATKMPAVPFSRWQRQGPCLILRVRWRQCSFLNRKWEEVAEFPPFPAPVFSQPTRNCLQKWWPEPWQDKRGREGKKKIRSRRQHTTQMLKTRLNQGNNKGRKKKHGW